MARQAPEQGLFYPGRRGSGRGRTQGGLAEYGRGCANRDQAWFLVAADAAAGCWLGTLLALVGQWLAGFGVFFWPKKVGALRR